jgi:hypothetical protein
LEQLTTAKMIFLCLRKANQDHVENLHCLIHAYHSSNDHPMTDAYDVLHPSSLQPNSFKSVLQQIVSLMANFWLCLLE